MTPHPEALETQLTEVELALLIAVNCALDAALLAGSRPEITLAHLAEHERNFIEMGKRKGANILAVLQVLHRHAAGLV